jgi:hypothetical protein
MILRKRNWLLWLGLGACCLLVIYVGSERLSSFAAGDLQVQTEVSVVPIQFGRDTYGLAMVDAKNETIWIYELSNRGPAHSRLKLLAARSWHYDKLLEEYNNAEPTPRQVKNIIEQLLKPAAPARTFEPNNFDISSIAEPNKSAEQNEQKME